jgi:hypothetical protein
MQVSTSSSSPNSTSSACKVTTQHLSDPPYQNYFYSDCHAATQVVVTSPLPDSNLTIIGPRLIIAWPAGNSGICTFFQPQNGVNGSLGLELVNSTVGSPLSAVYKSSGSGNPVVGVTGVLSFNSSAELTIPILGSIRNIRDFTEGPSILQPLIQGATNASENSADGGATIARLWLDNITTTTFTMTPFSGTGSSIKVKNKTLSFGAGKYTFSASFNYPQLEQLTAAEVLNSESKDLITQMPDQTTSLAFLSYTEKLLAGAWRFLTYFGRDSMISALLLEPVLSQGNGSAMEAVLGAVLERINRTDGSVCHEETIGDYATFLNYQNNITSTAASCTYPMIDTDYYLPILMDRYFTQSSVGPSRLQPFLARQAGSLEIDVLNKGLTYGDLALSNAEKIMKLAAAFAASGGQTATNLLHLKSDQIVGQWRDSTYGIGGGRIPFDVNTGLAPAALRSIAALSRFNSSIFPGHDNWGTLADTYAQVWEDKTLSFFEQSITPSEATSRLNTFVKSATFYDGPTHASTISNTTNTTFYSISLNGYNDLTSVDVLHTDTCFRLFLLNSTNQAQLTSFLSNVASSILRPFPAGLSTPVGLVVANPALGAQAVLTQNFTNAAYHGTVVWSWPLAMMAKGLELQLARCMASGDGPDFCKDTTGVYKDVKDAYNMLWNTIEANESQLSSEVWSCIYKGANFVTTPL